MHGIQIWATCKFVELRLLKTLNRRSSSVGGKARNFIVLSKKRQEITNFFKKYVNANVWTGEREGESRILTIKYHEALYKKFQERVIYSRNNNVPVMYQASLLYYT
jgi:hypothetical protein